MKFLLLWYTTISILVSFSSSSGSTPLSIIHLRNSLFCFVLLVFWKLFLRFVGRLHIRPIFREGCEYGCYVGIVEYYSTNFWSTEKAASWLHNFISELILSKVVLKRAFNSIDSLTFLSRRPHCNELCVLLVFPLETLETDATATFHYQTLHPG